MFGKFNLKNMMQNAQKMQEQMEKIEVTGEAGAGEVKLRMNARHVAKNIEFSDAILKESKEVIEELTLAAINDASRKIEEAAQNQMMDMSSIMGSFMNDNDKDDKN